MMFTPLQLLLFIIIPTVTDVHAILKGGKRMRMQFGRQTYQKDKLSVI